MSLLSTFKAKLVEFSHQDWADWLIGGFTEYHRTNSPNFHYADIAFEHARLSFGLSRDSDAVSDVFSAFCELDGNAKQRFQGGLARAIDQITVGDEASKAAISDLVLLALDTQSTVAIQSICNKLKIADRAVARQVALLAGFFLTESQNADATVKLAQALYKMPDFPEELTAQVLLALLQHDLKNAKDYLPALRESFEAQWTAICQLEIGAARFKENFCRALAGAPPDSPIFDYVLSEETWASQLVGYFSLSRPASEGVAGRVEYLCLFSVPNRFRTPANWMIVEVDSICPMALRTLLFKLDCAKTVGNLCEFVGSEVNGFMSGEGVLA